MRNALKRSIMLAACMALLCPAAALADLTAEETPVYAPINNAADLTGALPAETVSISLKTTPNNVIFNYGGLTITLVDYYKSGSNLYMDLVINNNTDSTFYIDVENASLNGMSCYSSAYISAPANQLSSDYIRFSTDSDLQRYMTMNDISDIEFSLQIFDMDAYYIFYEEAGYYADFDYFTGYITTAPIHFKDYGVQPVALDTGTLLYQGNGIKIIKKDMFIRNYGPADLHMVLYFENTSDEDIYINNDSNIINSYSVDPSFYGRLSAGQCVISNLVISESEIKALNVNKLSDIKKFEGSFSIYKGDEYDYYYGSYYSDNRVKTPMINFLK
ncbi:MAG: hypothetical protein ACRDBO_01585 [Lachnospiraceae bacterium]